MVDAYDPLQEKMQVAARCEQAGNIETAYRHFHEAASQALEQIANT